MKKRLSSEEIQKLPKEDFITYMEGVREEYYSKVVDIGNPEYHKYTFDDKIKYWCESMNYRMRMQAEKGLNPYLPFSADWYQAMKRIDPQLEMILDSVFEEFKFYGWEWSREEFDKHIGKVG